MDGKAIDSVIAKNVPQINTVLKTKEACAIKNVIIDVAISKIYRY